MGYASFPLADGVPHHHVNCCPLGQAPLRGTPSVGTAKVPGRANKSILNNFILINHDNNLLPRSRHRVTKTGSPYYLHECSMPLDMLCCPVVDVERRLWRPAWEVVGFKL